MEKSPSAFSVAHYVLLFLVSTACTVSVVWVLIAANNREAATIDKMERTSKTCQRDIADKITDLWEHDPTQVPQKYMNLVDTYANRIVTVRTTGMCNGKSFMCPMNTKRSACDPCAHNAAYKRAMFQHISDEIDRECKNK
ncbi:MAG: hypothetical protein J5608_03620 [Alphaproteobacteria bacterium]|nr:hypothetical protein [Alphaproteobacteria bacterium]